MKKEWLVKNLALGFVVLFISTGFIPITNGITQQKHELADNQISDSTVSNIEGKPDLVIEDIFLWPSDYPFTYHFECSVKNIGNSTNEWNNVEINVKIKWMFLSYIPLLSITAYTESHYILGVIESGRMINLSFASCDCLPKFGTYRFYLTVNPHKIIEESDYDNNKYSEDWKVFFGQWKQI